MLCRRVRRQQIQKHECLVSSQVSFWFPSVVTFLSFLMCGSKRRSRDHNWPNDLLLYIFLSKISSNLSR